MSDSRVNGRPLPPHPDAGWQETVEELQTAQEEMRQQNDALVEAARTVEAERQRYQELFNFAPDCYVVTNRRGTVRQANHAAAALFRRPVKFFAEKPMRVLIHPDHRRRYDQILRQLLNGEPVRGVKIDVQSREGATIPADLHGHITRDEHGEISGVLWLLHDLTDLNAVQERAVKAERLAAMGQTVAALAHESRNALQRSQACLRLLALEVQDRPKATDYVERVEKALAGLHRLFEDVRAVTTTPRMEIEPCNLADLWREAWEQVEPARAGRDCALAEEVNGVDLAGDGDPFRLVQMFRNLFDNAIAATPDPVRITVRVAVERLNDHPAVSVEVADNGPGMTDDQRATAFEPFITTKPGGMGLGLALVRRIAEAHGGKVEAVEAAGGAVIRVTFPRGGGEGGR
jgi:PAS domain S-box-containing protein